MVIAQFKLFIIVNQAEISRHPAAIAGKQLRQQRFEAHAATAYFHRQFQIEPAILP